LLDFLLLYPIHKRKSERIKELLKDIIAEDNPTKLKDLKTQPDEVSHCL
jgi:hypothetical protein